MTTNVQILEKYLKNLGKSKPPMLIKKAENALLHSMRVEGVVKSRYNHICDFFRNGATFNHKRIYFTGGGFMDAGEVTKTGIAFAEFCSAEIKV